MTWVDLKNFCKQKSVAISTVSMLCGYHANQLSNYIYKRGDDDIPIYMLEVISTAIEFAIKQQAEREAFTQKQIERRKKREIESDERFNNWLKKIAADIEHYSVLNEYEY